MKKYSQCLFGIFCFIFFIVSVSYADFNYGKDTYEKVDDSLIVNSLGDQVEPSTFGKLGVNDFIPENAVKNYLAIEGYTQAVDYNPAVTNPQYASYYSEKPEEGYVKLTFAGLEGDPRKTQDVWVLEKEYYKYSSQSQDERINNEADVRASADNTLQGNINTVNSNSISRDNLLGGRLDTETTNRINADTFLQEDLATEQFDRIQMGQNLQNNIDTEVIARTDADTQLQDNINTETTERKNADNVLTNNLNSEIQTRGQADITLQNNITSVDNKQTAWNNTQDSAIQSNTSRINDLDGRVSDLEKTQSIIGGEVRIYDSKKWTVSTFVDYSTTRSTVDRAGIKFTFKIGKSYEETKIEELEAKINKLVNINSKEQVVSDGQMYTQGAVIGIRDSF